MNPARVTRDDSAMVYDPIKPDHVNIIDLHVDRQLKPFHLLASKSSSWRYTDPAVEERRRQCIVQYLLEDDAVLEEPDRGRYVSMGNLYSLPGVRVRHNSLDDIST